MRSENRAQNKSFKLYNTGVTDTDMRVNYSQYYCASYPGYFYQVSPHSVKRIHTQKGGDKQNRKVEKSLDSRDRQDKKQR